MDRKKTAGEIRPLSEVVRSWFCLTARERLALLLIVSLLTLGLTARFIYLRSEKPVAVPIPTTNR